MKIIQFAEAKREASWDVPPGLPARTDNPACPVQDEKASNVARLRELPALPVVEGVCTRSLNLVLRRSHAWSARSSGRQNAVERADSLLLVSSTDGSSID